MKLLIASVGVFAALGLTQFSWAQSTTGGRSGGSTASTGSGYLTEGRRPAEGSPASMTIDDEGSARGYLWVPPTPAKNRAASPSGPSSAKAETHKSTPQPTARKKQ